MTEKTFVMLHTFLFLTNAVLFNFLLIKKILKKKKGFTLLFSY